MKRIHAALGRGATATPTEPPPAVDESVVRLASQDDDLLAMFAERAKGVGMVVHRVRRDLAVGTLVAILRELKAEGIGVAAGTAGQQIGLPESLRGAGFTLLDWAAQQGLDPQYDLDAGITDVHAAIAEAGTLVCSSGPAPGSSRGLSLIPPVHVALVRRSDLVPDMIDFYRRFRGLPPAELPSSIAFITGPSKTADIEGELITGVHGPGHVHVVLVEDL